MSHSALRALLRIESRHVRVNPLRSFLIVLLVAIPTAAMVGGSAFITALKRTVEDQQNEVMGLASIRLDGSEALPIERAVEQIPQGTRYEFLGRGVAVVARPGQRLRARSFYLSPEALEPSGLASTMLRIQDGRAPRDASEAALSSGLLTMLHLGIGDMAEVEGRSRTITGVALVPEQLSLPTVVLTPEAAPAGVPRALLVDLDPVGTEQLADEWTRAGGKPNLRDETGFGDSFESVVIFVCGSFGFFEAALVIGAAIAVGMRRRQRELGLLGSNGAQRRPMVLALLLSTGMQAAVGALIGLAVGAAAAFLVHPYLSGWVDRDCGAFELPMKFIVGSFLLGVSSAILSAWLPARAAVRLPVKTALSGRRPVKAGSRGFLRAGAALVVLGSALVAIGSLSPGNLSGLAILLGAIVLVLGLGTLSPWILEQLARLAGRLPVPWRLAVRDAGRFRARNGPVVTAVIAGMSISVLLGCVGASVLELQASRRPAQQPNELRVEGPDAESLAQAIGSDFGGDVALAPKRTFQSRGGETVAPAAWIVAMPAPVTRDLAESAITLAAAYPRSSISSVALEAEPRASFFGVVLWICIATGLVVIFVATTLSSVESAADSGILRTVGAAPGVLRQHAASRAAYLALLGCTLAVPAGLVPMIGLLRLSGGSLPFVMPWQTILIAVGAMPLIGYFGTWLAAVLRPPGRA